jgi:glycosyltransferase involved in cell wall biosynthesis
MPPSLSVVIPTFNDSHCLALTLGSLARQRLAAEEFEVIVVGDGGAIDEAVVKSIASLGYRYVELPRHVGRAAARNRGIEVSRGEVVVFLDSDSFAAPDLLERHHRFHHDGAGSRVLLGKRWEIGWPAMDDVLRGRTPDRATLRRQAGDLRFPEWLRDAQIEEYLQTPWLFTYTNNVSVRRDLIESIGGFDEQFGTRWGFEDLDLFYRAYLALGRPPAAFVYDPEAGCYHLPHYRSAAGIREDYFVNMSRVKAKYRTYEWEFTGLLEPPQAAARIRRYRDAFAATERAGAGRAGPVWHRGRELFGIGPDAGLLVIGLGTEELGLPERTATFDLCRPVSEYNLHLLGYATGYTSDDFDVVVNLNVWRWLTVHDLSRYVDETLRIARASVLVYSSDVDMPPGGHDVGYVVQMLRPYVETSLQWAGPDAVITLRQRGIRNE